MSGSVPTDLVATSVLISRFTSAELTTLCGTPAGIAALISILALGPAVRLSNTTLTTILAGPVAAGSLTQARATAILGPLTASGG